MKGFAVATLLLILLSMAGSGQFRGERVNKLINKIFRSSLIVNFVSI